MPTFAPNAKSKSSREAWLLPTRHNALYLYGVISFTPALQLGQHQRELNEVLGPEVRSSGGEDYEWIGANNICPDRWQRAHPSLSGLSEEDPVLAPRVGEPDKLVFVAAQRMERVRYTESLRIAAIAGS